MKNTSIGYDLNHPRVFLNFTPTDMDTFLPAANYYFHGMELMLTTPCVNEPCTIR